ncbi:MAG: O-antigen ligase family protein [Micavibrio sp.]|nr:O-antigen ligase family protein [Micavibrio sp.]
MLGYWVVALLPDFFRRTAEEFYRSAADRYGCIGGKQESAQEYGHAERMDIIHGAIAMFKERPIQGAGLGSALYFQRQETGKTLDIIDCTSLWILSEMGIIGFLVFAGSYLLMVLALLKKAKEDAFARGVLIILLCFGIFSLFHELLYTRFLWFMLGLALVRPRQDAQAT